MHSMTGYGSANLETGQLRVSCRIRSVNHRFLDLVLRMPEDLRPLEPALKERIGQRLCRGRIELRLEVDDRRQRSVEVRVNKSWIAALDHLSKELKESGLKFGRLRLGDLLKIPDAVHVSTNFHDDDAESNRQVLAALDGALEDLVGSRAREGEKLQIVLLELLERLSGLIGEISSQQDPLHQEQQERLRRRVQELMGTGQVLDEARLEQELAILAERSDVREELDRLHTHVDHFEHTMKQSGAVGKKLDFIAQEMARELTPPGAKCRQPGVQQRNMDAKLACEQLREQIQNIE